MRYSLSAAYSVVLSRTEYGIVKINGVDIHTSDSQWRCTGFVTRLSSLLMSRYSDFPGLWKAQQLKDWYGVVISPPVMLYLLLRITGYRSIPSLIHHMSGNFMGQRFTS